MMKEEEENLKLSFDDSMRRKTIPEKEVEESNAHAFGSINF